MCDLNFILNFNNLQLLIFEFYFFCYINTITFKIKYLYYVQNLELNITHNTYPNYLSYSQDSDPT